MGNVFRAKIAGRKSVSENKPIKIIVYVLEFKKLYFTRRN